MEHAEDIMDHCIEVESNERMRNENIDRWTLRFKQPEIETKVRIQIYYRIFNYPIIFNYLHYYYNNKYCLSILLKEISRQYKHTNTKL